MIKKYTDINFLSNLKYATDGFEILDIFKKSEIENCLVDFYNRLLMQAYKLRLVDIYNPMIYGDQISIEKIDNLVISINKKNKISVDYAVQELRECPSFYKLVNSNFLNNSSRILNCPASLLKIHFDGILVNIPNNSQRLYRFHSESHYYPYRKNFFNLWMPVGRQKDEFNGAMLIKRLGHTRRYSFNEYSGFDRVEGYQTNEENFMYQLEIPDHEIQDLETVVAALQPGSSLVFHGNLPHTSVLNISDKPSYALIARVYDYRQDLTLSDRTGIRLYQGAKGGFPGLRPIITTE